MTVRAPREDDAEALARVHERGWTISHAEHGAEPGWITSRLWRERVDEWRGFCRGEGRPMWVAEEEGGAVVGFVAAGASRDEDAPPGTGEVVALYVDPDAQRDGHGAALLERAVDALREQGFARATLWTFTAAPDARAFYEAQGWRHDGAVKDDPRGEHVRYERAL